MRPWKKLTLSLLCAIVMAVVASSAMPSSGTGSSAVASNDTLSATLGVADLSLETLAPAGAETTISAVEVSADFVVLYASVDELREAADLVVSGEVVDVSYLDFKSTTYTEVTFKVNKCLKGKAIAGDTITIAEIGGLTTMAAVNGDKFGPASEEDAGTVVKVQLEGAPLSEVGDECTYFLGTGLIGVLPGAYYVPLGAFQGRFAVESGVASRFVPADWQSPNYSALAMSASALDEAISAESGE